MRIEGVKFTGFVLLSIGILAIFGLLNRSAPNSSAQPSAPSYSSATADVTATESDAPAAPATAEANPTGPNLGAAWMAEKQRPKSAGLQAYEDAAEPIDQQIAIANVLGLCGLRSGDWYRAEDDELEGQRVGPVVGPLFQQLSGDERFQARSFDRIVAHGVERFWLGPSGNDCHEVAKQPFAQ